MKAWLSLLLPPILGGLAYLFLPEDGLSPAGRATAAMAIWMAGWWVTEIIPIAATALLPIALFPLLGIATIGDTTAPYGHKLIFLFLGGFMIAIAIERWGLHRRIALLTIKIFGTTPSRIIAGFMVATAFLSMWISNTAVAVLMLPIGTSLIELIRNRDDHKPSREGVRFSRCLMLAIAYAASIGGVGTLIGTPPNALLAAFVDREYGITISFSQWLRIGLPLVVVFLPLTWLLLTKVLFPLGSFRIEGGHELIEEEFQALGPMKTAEKIVLGVFLLAAGLWVLRPLLISSFPGELLSGLNDTSIAILAALLLFVLPACDPERQRLLNWKSATQIPWGILLLFGGGLSLASAMNQNGVATFIGGSLSALGSVDLFWIILATATIIIFLTELTSNTATAAAFYPILAAVALGLRIHPFLLLVPAAFAASCAFMLPVATPPNAIVFASGYLRIPQMVKAGFWLNIIGVLLATIITYFFLGSLLGENLTVPLLQP